MIPWNEVMTFSEDTILDENGLRNIHASGFSRVPVWRNKKHNIVGLCLVKNLVPVRPSPNTTLKLYCRRKPLIVTKDMNLFDCLNLFQDNRSHLALVVDNINESKIIQKCFRNNQIIPQKIGMWCTWCMLCTLCILYILYVALQRVNNSVNLRLYFYM